MKYTKAVASMPEVLGINSYSNNIDYTIESKSNYYEPLNMIENQVNTILTKVKIARDLNFDDFLNYYQDLYDKLEQQEELSWK